MIASIFQRFLIGYTVFHLKEWFVKVLPCGFRSHIAKTTEYKIFFITRWCLGASINFE